MMEDYNRLINAILRLWYKLISDRFDSVDAITIDFESIIKPNTLHFNKDGPITIDNIIKVLDLGDKETNRYLNQYSQQLLNGYADYSKVLLLQSKLNNFCKFVKDIKLYNRPLIRNFINHSLNTYNLYNYTHLATYIDERNNTYTDHYLYVNFRANKIIVFKATFNLTI